MNSELFFTHCSMALILENELLEIVLRFENETQFHFSFYCTSLN